MLIKNLSTEQEIRILFLKHEFSKEILDHATSIIQKLLLDNPRDIVLDLMNIESLNINFVARFLYLKLIVKRTHLNISIINPKDSIVNELVMLAIEPKNYNCADCLGVDTCPHKFSPQKLYSGGLCPNKKIDRMQY